MIHTYQDMTGGEPGPVHCWATCDGCQKRGELVEGGTLLEQALAKTGAGLEKVYHNGKPQTLCATCRVSVLPLTARQLEVARAIKALTKAKGIPPSLVELGEAIGARSSNTVFGHLKALRKKGWLARPPRFTNRGLRLLRDPEAA